VAVGYDGNDLFFPAVEIPKGALRSGENSVFEVGVLASFSGPNGVKVDEIDGGKLRGEPDDIGTSITPPV
jgi:hypothetical protein